MGGNGSVVVAESVMQSVEQGGVGVSSVGADSDLDLRALGAALWRKKWLVLIPTRHGCRGDADGR